MLTLSSQVNDANSFGQLQKFLQSEQSETALKPLADGMLPQTSPSGAGPGQAPRELSTKDAQPQRVIEVEASSAAESPTPSLEQDDGLCRESSASGLYCVYTVEQGDTLSGIAAALGLDGTRAFHAAQLISLSNGLGDADVAYIHPGQELRIPSLPGVLHTVYASEVLSQLAAAYDVSITDIMNANGIADANSLIEGSVILIPSPLSFPASSSDLHMAKDDSDSSTETETMAVLVEEESEDSETDATRSVTSFASSLSQTFSLQASTSQSSETNTSSASAGEPGSQEPSGSGDESTGDPDEDQGGSSEDIRKEDAADREAQLREFLAALSARGDGTPSTAGSMGNVAAAPEQTPPSDEDSNGRVREEEATATPTPSPEPTREEDEDEASEPSPTASARAEEPAATPTPTRTSAPSPTPTQAPRTQNTSVAANPPVETIKRDFSAGYRSVGGSESYLSHILDKVIPCESSYNVRAYNPAGPYYGLMQFLEATWIRSGGGDWYDAWQQGANTARLLKSAKPETQWPYCWRR